MTGNTPTKERIVSPAHNPLLKINNPLGAEVKIDDRALDVVMPRHKKPVPAQPTEAKPAPVPQEADAPSDLRDVAPEEYIETPIAPEPTPQPSTLAKEKPAEAISPASKVPEEEHIELTDAELADDEVSDWLAGLAAKDKNKKEYKDPTGAEFRQGVLDAYAGMEGNVQRSKAWHARVDSLKSKQLRDKIDAEYVGTAKLPAGFELPRIGERRDELERLLPKYREMASRGLKPRLLMEVNGLDRTPKSEHVKGLSLPNGNINQGIIRSDMDRHRKSTGHELEAHFSLIADEKLPLRADGQRGPSQPAEDYDKAIATVADLLHIPKDKVDKEALRRISPDDDTYVAFVRDCAQRDLDVLQQEMDASGTVGTIGKTMVKAPEGGFRPGVFRINESESKVELSSQDVSAYGEYKPEVGLRVAFKGTDLLHTAEQDGTIEDAEAKDRLKASPKTLGAAASGIVNGADGFPVVDKTPAELKREIVELKARLEGENAEAVKDLPVKYIDTVLKPFVEAQDRPAEKRIPEIKEFADVIQDEKFRHRLELRANAGDNPQVLIVPLDFADKKDMLDRMAAGDRKKYFESDAGFAALQKLLAEIGKNAATPKDGAKRYAAVITSRPRKGFEIAGLSTNKEIVDEWFQSSKPAKK